MQASTEAQQAEHAAQVASMSTEAEQLQSLVRQLTEQDQQRLTDLEGQKADASNLRQVCFLITFSSSGKRFRNTEVDKELLQVLDSQQD